MEQNLKKCKQCGEVRSASQYRKYYGGRTGSYNTCKICERINNRAKYLEGKGETYLLPHERNELDQIYELWKRQRLAGLVPPRSQPGRRSVAEDINSMLSSLSPEILGGGDAASQTLPHFIPAELQQWLILELTEEPEYYQDTIYEDLKEKYRPVQGINQHGNTPIYDDTYRDILLQIAARFDAYEDDYYKESDEDADLAINPNDNPHYDDIVHDEEDNQ